MSRPDPIQYAERLYAAIRTANFSPISFLTFGNAVKDGVDLRRMPRIAAEPFMRVVGEMLDLEEEAAIAVPEAELLAPEHTATPHVEDAPSVAAEELTRHDGAATAETGED
jgi:hypothetical protein